MLLRCALSLFQGQYCTEARAYFQPFGRLFAFSFLAKAYMLSKFGVGYPQEVKRNSSILTHKQTIKKTQTLHGQAGLMILFHVSDFSCNFLKSFPEASHFYFNYMILGWTVQYSGWVEKVEKTCQFPHGFYMLCFLQPKKYIVSVYTDARMNAFHVISDVFCLRCH